MTNCDVKREGDKLTITIDLSRVHGPSKSGKTIIIATTSGAVDVGDGIKLGLNCYKSKSVL